jgi:PleD family two-component response regulator
MGSSHPQARVLVASGEEMLARSLETILAPAGFSVVQAFTGQNVLNMAQHDAPDAFILDLQSPDIAGLGLCRALRTDPHVTVATPIIVITASAATRQLRLDALRAGASDLRSGTLDAEEFLLDLTARLGAKFDVDEARRGGLTDARTGVYNAQGLARRAHEVAAAAARYHAVFGCAAFAPDTRGASPDFPELGDLLGRAFHSEARTSDAPARVAPTEFVVLAPETGAAGTARLAERLARAVERAVNTNGGLPIRLRTAYYALAEPPTASLDPLMPVQRARAGLGTISAP